MVTKQGQSFKIGPYTFVTGKCDKARSYLKKDLKEMHNILNLSFSSSDTNPTLCARIEKHLLSGAPPVQVQVQAPAAVQTVAQAVYVLGEKGLRVNGIWYSLDDCQQFSKSKLLAAELKRAAEFLGVSSKGTKKSICEALKKKHQALAGVPGVPTPLVIQQQAVAVTKISYDGVPISLENCHDVDIHVLKAIAKRLHTAISNDKTILCKRIASKYKGEVIHLSSTDISKKTTTTKKKAVAPPLSPSQQLTAKDFVYDAESDSITFGKHTFRFGKCGVARFYKKADLQVIAKHLHLTLTSKETIPNICKKIEAKLLPIKQQSLKNVPAPSQKTKTPSPPPVVPSTSPLKKMSDEEIRQAIRKCLNLT